MSVRRFLKVITVTSVKSRHFFLAACMNKAFNKPPSANELPRPAGISSMFRLPVVSSSEGTDILALLQERQIFSGCFSHR